MIPIFLVLSVAAVVAAFIGLAWLARTFLDRLHVTDFERRALADRAAIQLAERRHAKLAQLGVLGRWAE